MSSSTPNGPGFFQKNILPTDAETVINLWSRASDKATDESFFPRHLQPFGDIFEAAVISAINTPTYLIRGVASFVTEIINLNAREAVINLGGDLYKSGQSVLVSAISVIIAVSGVVFPSFIIALHPAGSERRTTLENQVRDLTNQLTDLQGSQIDSIRQLQEACNEKINQIVAQTVGLTSSLQQNTTDNSQLTSKLDDAFINIENLKLYNTQLQTKIAEAEKVQENYFELFKVVQQGILSPDSEMFEFYFLDHIEKLATNGSVDFAIKLLSKMVAITPFQRLKVIRKMIPKLQELTQFEEVVKLVNSIPKISEYENLTNNICVGEIHETLKSLDVQMHQQNFDPAEIKRIIGGTFEVPSEDKIQQTAKNLSQIGKKLSDEYLTQAEKESIVIRFGQIIQEVLPIDQKDFYLTEITNILNNKNLDYETACFLADQFMSKDAFDAFYLNSALAIDTDDLYVLEIILKKINAPIVGRSNKESFLKAIEKFSVNAAGIKLLVEALLPKMNKEQPEFSTACRLLFNEALQYEQSQSICKKLIKQMPLVKNLPNSPKKEMLRELLVELIEDGLMQEAKSLFIEFLAIDNGANIDSQVADTLIEAYSKDKNFIELSEQLIAEIPEEHINSKNLVILSVAKFSARLGKFDLAKNKASEITSKKIQSKACLSILSEAANRDEVQFRLVNNLFSTFKNSKQFIDKDLYTARKAMAIFAIKSNDIEKVDAYLSVVPEDSSDDINQEVAETFLKILNPLKAYEYNLKIKNQLLRDSFEKRLIQNFSFDSIIDLIEKDRCDLVDKVLGSPYHTITEDKNWFNLILALIGKNQYDISSKYLHKVNNGRLKKILQEKIGNKK